MLASLQTFWKKHHIKFLVGIIIFSFIALLAHRGKQRALDARELYVVQARDITEEVVIAGRVRTQQRADLAFNRSGRIATILVSEGEMVKKGQRLARISMGQLYADLDAARADLDVATADVDAAKLALENVEREQQTLIDNAYRTLLNNDLQAYNDDLGDSAIAPTISGSYFGAEEGEYVLDVYTSGSDFGFSYKLSGLENGTDSAYEIAPDTLGSRGLFIQFDASSRYDNQTWRIPVPNTRSATYTSAYNAYQAAVASAQRAIDTARDQLERIEAQEVNQERSTRAQARVNGIYAQIADGTITAPFDGVVGSIEKEIGENVSTGQAMITLIGEESYEMVLNVPEIDIAKVVVGDSVELVLDAYPDVVWGGVVSSINGSETIVDGVPVYETTVVLDNPDERVRSGMSGKGTIVTGQSMGALAIPVRALERSGRDAYTVQIIKNEKTETIEVTPGLRGNDSFIEIIEGLSVDDVVVIEG